MKRIYYFIILFMFMRQCISKIYSVYMKLPEINVTHINMTSHLELGHIKKICNNRGSICKSNDTKVCAMRKLNATFEYEDFDNSCFLFLSNMCDHPGKEFAIVEAQMCEVYLKSRRHYESSGVTEDVPIVPNYNPNDTGWDDGNTTRPALREFSFSTLYEMETAYDGHICPMSCTDVYAPVCVNANRGFGKYLKFYQFINHCESDKYYCKYWEEFQPPPDRDTESVSSSPLGWSYCGASRYLQFSLLSQTTSSMGHYGWLDGEHRFSKILEPWQRKPGYG